MKREQIEDLLKRYLDGETTNEEEQLLRQYFATTQIVPPEWKVYKALFGWENDQRTEQREPAVCGGRLLDNVLSGSRHGREPSNMLEWSSRDGRRQSQRQSASSINTASAPIARKYRMPIAASIAALFVIGAGITAGLLHSSHPDQQGVKSYAILDGHYTTDETVIAHEVEEALLMVSASDEETFDAIDYLTTQ